LAHPVSEERLMPTRRDVLSTGAHACTAALAAGALGLYPHAATEVQRFVLIGLTGPGDPARASLLFAWASALAEAGHIVRVELAGDAALLLRREVADSLVATGLPPLRDIMAKAEAHGIPIFVCRPCAMARGVAESDLEGRNAQFTNAQVMAADMVWATKVLVV
jgi:uncharacterized protein involved in oxidation of intracellular sulfur